MGKPRGQLPFCSAPSGASPRWGEVVRSGLQELSVIWGPGCCHPLQFSSSSHPAPNAGVRQQVASPVTSQSLSPVETCRPLPRQGRGEPCCTGGQPLPHHARPPMEALVYAFSELRIREGAGSCGWSGRPDALVPCLGGLPARVGSGTHLLGSGEQPGAWL